MSYTVTTTYSFYCVACTEEWGEAEVESGLVQLHVVNRKCRHCGGVPTVRIKSWVNDSSTW